MGFYNQHILPRVIDWTCKQSPNIKQREKIVPFASGKVLEIGIGSGLNLPFYNTDTIDEVVGIDPSAEIWAINKIDIAQLPFDFIAASAESIPVSSKYFDSVVITYAMCTIKGVDKAMNEIRRVLKPNGSLWFCEHGRAPDENILKWQNRINPLWKRLGGGCHLNRDIPAIIKSNGFKVNHLEAMYIPGWKPASFNYWGEARPD